jgi:hypothetical protein
MRRPFFSLAFALFFIPEVEAATTPDPSCVQKLPLLVSVALPSPVRPVFGYTRAAGVLASTGTKVRSGEKNFAPDDDSSRFIRAAEELESTGTIVRPGEKLPVLEDDNYLFIVVNLTGKRGDETVVYSPRAPAPLATSPTEGGAAFVATHPSLVRRLSGELKVNEEIVTRAVYGSGEFQSVFGNLQLVTNASPFFRSDPEHLDYSVSVLDNRMENTLPGFPERVLVPKEQRMFEGEKNLAQVAIANRSEPDRALVRQDLAVLIRRLVTKVPSQEIRGGIDVELLNELRTRYLATYGGREPRRPGLFADNRFDSVIWQTPTETDFRPLIPLVTVERSKGLDLAVEKFCKDLGSNCHNQFEIYFKNFISAIGMYSVRKR